MPLAPSKRWLSFLLLHLVALLLVLSWLFPPSRVYWDSIDVAAFRWLNSNLEDSPFLQLFWAIANVKCVDIFGAVYMASFFLLYVFDQKGKYATERLAQFFYLLIWGEIGILFSKEGATVILKMIGYMRDSPTIVLNNPLLLSHAAPWLNVKDSSHFSFPSDHALIVLQWAGFVWFFCGKRLGAIATISATFFALPRLIAGAHWLSDALVGSLSIVLVLLAWATSTPLYPWLMKYLIKLSSLILRKPNSKS